MTNDDKARNRTITFTVVSSPRFGRLLRMNSDNRTEGVSIFTQSLVSTDTHVVTLRWAAGLHREHRSLVLILLNQLDVAMARVTLRFI